MSEHPNHLRELILPIVDEAIKPLLTKITTLELILTVVSNKINDAQCRQALQDFCNAQCTDEVIIKPKESLPKLELRNSNVKETLIEYFAKLDPEFKTGKTIPQLRDETKLQYQSIYACLHNNPEDFELKYGLWYPRTTPIEKYKE